jgi:hypothetical protein
MPVFTSAWRRGASARAQAEGGPSPDGVARLWVQPQDPAAPIDRIALAVMADFLPSGIGNALGTAAGGNSLDNTIRFARIVPTKWVLADIRIHAASQGFVHGRVHLFAQTGQLLLAHRQPVDDPQGALRRRNMAASMSGKVNWFDNAKVATFFKTLKSELI